MTEPTFLDGLGPPPEPVPTRFVFRKEHYLLLRRLHVFWYHRDDCHGLNIARTRPFGNSDIEGDICEILGFKPQETDEGFWSADQRKHAEAIMRDMEYALQIALCCYPAEPGVYSRIYAYDCLSWRKIGDVPERPAVSKQAE